MATLPTRFALITFISVIGITIYQNSCTENELHRRIVEWGRANELCLDQITKKTPFTVKYNDTEWLLLINKLDSFSCRIGRFLVWLRRQICSRIGRVLANEIRLARTNRETLKQIHTILS